MTTGQPLTLICPTCGASTPIVSDEQTTCLFCLSRVAVPRAYRHRVAAQSRIQEKLENKLAESVGALYGGTSSLLSVKIIVVFQLVVMAATYLLWTVRSISEGYAFPWIALVPMSAALSVPIAFLLIVWFYRFVDAVVRKARMPLGGINLVGGETVVLQCPNCGAPQEKIYSVDHSCRNCRTSMLVPAYFLDRYELAHLQKVLEYRKKYEGQLERTEIPGFVAIVALFLYGLGGAILSYGGIANNEAVFFPLGLLGPGLLAIFGFFAWLFLRVESLHVAFRLFWAVAIMAPGLIFMAHIWSVLLQVELLPEALR